MADEVSAMPEPSQPPAAASEETTVLRRPTGVTPAMPGPLDPTGPPATAASAPDQPVHAEETAVLPAVERPTAWPERQPAATPAAGTEHAVAPIPEPVAQSTAAPPVVLPASATGLDDLLEPDVAPVPAAPAGQRAEKFRDWCCKGDNGLILGTIVVGLLLLLVVFAG
jgi:hypothetical protein